ncbi:chromobox protein homolog 3-like [Chironomus tepperi]|uniref:chromobox protein homolog 3-like n=1 Tax=Chironomus tepperi TaxID=113505 RepID=UPI00391F8F81
MKEEIREEADSTTEGSMVPINDDHFEMEELIDKTFQNERVEYWVKWKGYSHYDNTWEPVENIDPELIAAYEEKEAKKKMDDEKKTIKRRGRKNKKAKSINNPNKVPEGFDTNLIPEKIIGASKDDGQLKFLMKYQDCFKVSIVPASEANVVCPQIVIKFYEEIISWH